MLSTIKKIIIFGNLFCNKTLKITNFEKNYNLSLNENHKSYWYVKYNQIKIKMEGYNAFWCCTMKLCSNKYTVEYNVMFRVLAGKQSYSWLSW